MRLGSLVVAAALSGCSCGDGASSKASGDAAAGGGAASGGGGGAAASAGAGGGDAAADAPGDAGQPFECQHAPVQEQCQDGWCRVPAGCFVIGSPADEWGRGAYSEDQVKVTLTRPVLIQQKETTQAEWTALGLPNPSAPPIKPGNSGDCLQPDCPVGNVNWFEAAAFANLLSAKAGFPPCYVLQGCTGQIGEGMTCSGIGTTTPTYYDCAGYRLPGEAEWEYAARAGTSTPFYTGPITKYPGDTFACAQDQNLVKAAWYCANSGTLTHPGGLKAKNAWGLHDMLGNAHEWTNDVMKGLGYGTVPLVDPWGGLKVATPSELVVLRGGGPITPATGCRAADHFSVTRSGRGGGIGFRLVRSLLPPSDGGPSDATAGDSPSE